MLPLNSRFIVRFGTTTLPLKLAVLPSNDCVALMVPDTLIPVPVTVNIFALPATLTVIFPFAAGMSTLLLPLLILLELIDTQLKLPLPLVLNTCPLLPPVIMTLATLPKLAVLEATKSPIVKLLKLPVLPSSSKLTVKLLETLTKFADAKFPSTALPARMFACSVNVTTSLEIDTCEPKPISALLTSQPMNATFALVS